MSRYLPAELAAVFAALAGALVGWNLTASFEAAALAGNWAEAGAFYLVMAMRDFAALQTGRGRLATMRVVARNLTLEFALAELLDSLIVRPFLMDLGMRAMGLPAVGLIAGKLCADVTFYVPTIISYELRRRHVVPGWLRECLARGPRQTCRTLDAGGGHRQKHESGLERARSNPGARAPSRQPHWRIRVCRLRIMSATWQISGVESILTTHPGPPVWMLGSTATSAADSAAPR